VKSLGPTGWGKGKIMDMDDSSLQAVRRRLAVTVTVLGLVALACGPLGQLTGGGEPTPTLIEMPTEAPPAEQPTAGPPTETATLDTSNANLQLTAIFESTHIAETAAAVPAGGLEQWAIVATASSQYTDNEWSASRATGAPDAYPACGDNVNAWASESGSSANEFLQLVYETPVTPTRIDIYEVAAPGSIIQVEVVDQAGQSHIVYQAPAAADQPCPRILTIGVVGLDFKVNGVIIRLDQTLNGYWNEIDAVKLVGNP